MLDERVPLLTSSTPAQRLGEWPELTFSALAIAALAWAIGLAVAGRRRSRRAGPGAAAA